MGPAIFWGLFFIIFGILPWGLDHGTVEVWQFLVYDFFLFGFCVFGIIEYSD